MMYSLTLTDYRREDLVAAAEYTVDALVLEGTEDHMCPYYITKYFPGKLLDKWMIYRDIVVPQKGLCRTPICRMVIGPRGMGLGALSVSAINVYDHCQEFSEFSKITEFNAHFCENLKKSILARAKKLFCSAESTTELDASSRTVRDKTRLRAARAMEIYQEAVTRDERPTFVTIAGRMNQKYHLAGNEAVEEEHVRYALRTLRKLEGEDKWPKLNHGAKQYKR